MAAPNAKVRVRVVGTLVPAETAAAPIARPAELTPPPPPATPIPQPNLADSASAAGSNASLASSSGGEMPAVRRLQELQPRGSMSLERHSYREGDLLGMEAALQADLRRTRSESATVDVMCVPPCSAPPPMSCSAGPPQLMFAHPQLMFAHPSFGFSV